MTVKKVTQGRSLATVLLTCITKVTWRRWVSDHFSSQ